MFDEQAVDALVGFCLSQGCVPSEYDCTRTWQTVYWMYKLLSKDAGIGITRVRAGETAESAVQVTVGRQSGALALPVCCG